MESFWDALEKQRKITFSTEAIDLKRFRTAVRSLYTKAGCVPVRTFRLKSPYAMSCIYSRLVGMDEPELIGDMSTVASIKIKSIINRKFEIIKEKLDLNLISAYDNHLLVSGSCYQNIRDYIDGIIRDFDSEDAAEEDSDLLETYRQTLRGIHAALFIIEQRNVGGGFGLSDQYELAAAEGQTIPSELLEIGRAAHYWMPMSNCVLVSDRPHLIHLDRQGRLHSEAEMAIRYRDGWGLYMLHGVQVPAHYVITPADRIRPMDVLQERNADVRMAVLSKIGWVKIVKKLSSRVISKGPDGRSELIEFPIDGMLRRGLHVFWREADGEHETLIPVPRTREEFGERCPNNRDDFEQVRLWTFGLNPKDIKIIGES